jgi:hypothetical protein
MCLFGAYDFDKDNFTKTEPQPEKVAGTYLPTKETLLLIKNIGLYDLQNISISLHSDGTFEMQNMPDWWITDYGVSNGGTDSGKGKWRVHKTTGGDWWQLELEFVSGTFSSKEYLSEGFYTEMHLSGEQPPYSLWVYVGDPDKGRVMIFEQIIENP